MLICFFSPLCRITHTFIKAVYIYIYIYNPTYICMLTKHRHIYIHRYIQIYIRKYIY